MTRRRNLLPREPPSVFLLDAFRSMPFAVGATPVAVCSTIEPQGERWVWRNEWVIWGHPNIMEYQRAGRFHPAPGAVSGRNRDRMIAEEERRESLQLMNALAVRILAQENYRAAMTHEEVMPI
jgi:hypothetical protein